MIYYNSRRHRQNKGQALVELALTLPIFLVLVYGIFEVARLVFMYSEVFNASRDAARYAGANGKSTEGVVYYRDCTGIRDHANEVSSIIDLSATDAVTIQYDKGPDSELIASSCEALVSSGTKLALGDRVVVTVTATYNPVVPLLNFEDIPISSTTARSVVADLDIWAPYE